MPALIQKLKNGFITKDTAICITESAETIKKGIKSIWQVKYLFEKKSPSLKKTFSDGIGIILKISDFETFKVNFPAPHTQKIIIIAHIKIKYVNTQLTAQKHFESHQALRLFEFISTFFPYAVKS